jgi:antitoxin component YwqK of YwqJK toxin-antitoxin module
MRGKIIPIVLFLLCWQYSFGQNHVSSEYYSLIGRFDGGYTDVMQNDKYGFINSKGDLIIPCVYDEVYGGDFDQWFDYGIVSLRKNKLWGALDSTGKVVVPFIYDTLSSFFNHCIAIVAKNSKHGCVNCKGELIVPCIYDKIWYLSEGIRQVKYNGKIGYQDSSGKQIIECKYSNGSSCGEGLIPVQKGTKWGYINKLDSVIIPFMYDAASSFKEGLAGVSLKGKEGFIDRSNKVIIPFIYSPGYYSFSQGYARVEIDGSAGMIDKKGKVIIPCEYNDYGWDAYANGCFIIQRTWANEPQTSALFDTTGKALTGFDYSIIGGFGNNRFLLTGKSKNEIRDRKGNLIATIESGEVWDCNYGILAVIRNDTVSYLDSVGKSFMPFTFSGKLTGAGALGFLFFDTIAVVPYYSSWRIINRRGQFIDHFKGTQAVKLYYENGILGTIGKLKNYSREGKWIFYYKNGKLEEEFNYKQGLKNGEYKNWDSTGILLENIIYRDDTVFKKIYEKPYVDTYNYGYKKPANKEYFSNGKLKYKGQYEENNFFNKTGKWIEGDTDKDNNYYYAEGEYASGEREGEWRHYNGKGKLLFTENYKNGMQQYPDGDVVMYNLYGGVSEKGQMVDNSKEGIWIYYNDDGSTSSETEYCLNEESGVSKEYFANGKLQVVQHYVLISEKVDSTYRVMKQRQDYKTDSGYLSSLYSGTWAEYYENGQVKDSGSFGLLKAKKDTSIHFNRTYSSSIDTVLRYGFVWSIKTGNWVEYYENGKTKSIGKYYPASISGEVTDTLQDENGNLKVVRCDNPIYLKDSTWKYYSESGELIREEFYDKAKLMKVKEYNK